MVEVGGVILNLTSNPAFPAIQKQRTSLSVLEVDESVDGIIFINSIGAYRCDEYCKQAD